MKVCQWNSHHGGKRTDGTLDTAGFGRTLKALACDVYCLNEVEQFDGYGNDDKVAKWAAALGPEWHGWFANLSGVIDGHGQGNAILARLADVEAQLLTVKTLWGSRVAVSLVVKGVTIVSTHLDDQLQTTRLVQMAQIFGWSPLTASKLAVCGDWNAVPTALEMAPWRTLLKDAWVESPIKSSFNGTGDTKSHRIDAIFYRGLTPLSCSVPDTSLNKVFPSDHHPVIAEFL